MVASVAGFAESAAIHGVRKAIEHCRSKLGEPLGQAKTAALLHAGERQHVISLEDFEQAIAPLSSADIRPLDFVFLVYRDGVCKSFTYRNVYLTTLTNRDL